MITLLLAMVLVLTLGGYLWWVRQQNLAVAESQAWNTAMAMAEAGIEEGMAQINVGAGTWDGTNFYPSIATNAAYWPGPSGNRYGPRVNTLTNGSYSALIDVSGTTPSIISTGLTANSVLGQPIARTVQVSTSAKPLFANAIAALQNVTLNGNGITVDSYDSSDLVHFPGGLWNQANRMAGGDVSSTGGLLGVGNANIYGHLRTGPNGTYSLGPNGSAGEVSWVDNPANAGKVEPGWYANDFNMDFPDVKKPYPIAQPLPTKTGNTNTFTSGNYYDSSGITINNNEVMVISGTVTIYETSIFNMKNGSSLLIQPGATLKLYVGNPTGAATPVSLNQVNNSGNANNFQFFGLPTVTSLSWGGNNSYMGTVYAPEAAFTLNGGGNTNLNYQGSCVVLSVTMNGSVNFHYDENLKRVGPASSYTVASWREL